MSQYIYIISLGVLMSGIYVKKDILKEPFKAACISMAISCYTGYKTVKSFLMKNETRLEKVFEIKNDGTLNPYPMYTNWKTFHPRSILFSRFWKLSSLDKYLQNNIMCKVLVQYKYKTGSENFTMINDGFLKTVEEIDSQSMEHISEKHILVVMQDPINGDFDITHLLRRYAGPFTDYHYGITGKRLRFGDIHTEDGNRIKCNVIVMDKMARQTTYKSNDYIP